MPQRRSDYLKQKKREFYILPPGHISAVLLSNSGNVPVADTKCVLTTADQRLEGTTDADGFIEFKEIPIDEYKLELVDHGAVVAVPAVPKDAEKVPVCVAGFELFGKDPSETQSDEEASSDSDDAPDDELLHQQAETDGWETASR